LPCWGLSYCAIVVGIALLVTGIGLILLAYAVFAPEPAARPTPAPAP
jgi:hypothetical protein